MLCLIHIFQHPFKDFLHVADAAFIDVNIFIDLAGVDIDLQDPRSSSPFLSVEGYPVAEPGTKRDNQIRLIDSPVCGYRAMHSHKTQIEFVVVADNSGRHQRMHRRDIRSGNQFIHRLTGVGGNTSSSDVRHRLLCVVDQPNRLRQFFLCGRRLRIQRQRRLIGKLSFCSRHILGDVYQHRSLSSAVRDTERIAESHLQIIHIVHEIIHLGDRNCNSRDINFLKSVTADQTVVHVRRDRHHRNAVHIRGGNSCHQIRRAWTAGGKDHSGSARRSGVSVRRMGSALLVRGHDVPDAIAVFIQFIIDVQSRSARVSENGIDPVIQKNLCYYLSPCQFHTTSPDYSLNSASP